MSETIHHLAEPPEWDTPEGVSLQEKYLKQFNATLPHLLCKVDSILPFVAGCDSREGIQETRSRVVVFAYARLWGLGSSVSNWIFFVTDGPNEPLIFEEIKVEDSTRIGPSTLSIGDHVLSDRGRLSQEENFINGSRELNQRLTQKQKTHPGAEIMSFCLNSVEVSSKFLQIPELNLDALEDYLFGLIKQWDPDQVELCVATTVYSSGSE